MAIKLDITPRIDLALKPGNSRSMQQLQNWMDRLRRETPVIRRALLRITAPAVGAGVIAQGTYAATVLTTGFVSSTADKYDVVEAGDIVLSFHIDNPPFYGAPPVILEHLHILAANQVLATWSNPTAFAYGGGNIDYELVIMKYR